MNAIITGAASGIGSACAAALAHAAQLRGEKANLLLVDFAEDKLLEVTRQLRDSGFNAISLAGDMGIADFASHIANHAKEVLEAWTCWSAMRGFS